MGKELLRLVLRVALRMAGDFGCVGVVVDAKPGAARFYEDLGFIVLDVVEGKSEARPVPTAMFLPVRDIQAANKGKGRP